MAIDECQCSFKKLADDCLPSLMKKMQEALERPTPMSEFGKKGVGKATILKCLGKKTDFQGCYVLRDESGPLYVGISRGVIQRLIQHVKGKTHFDASFAYRIASDNYKHEMSRKEAMACKKFIAAFNEAKSCISSMSVAYIEIANDLELYLFEVYCCMELDTSRWNTFKTH